LGSSWALASARGFRTGCKAAPRDDSGTLPEAPAIPPHPPQKKKADARHKLEELIRRHQTPVVAIGNGTACRETEEIVAELIAEFEKRRQAGVRSPESGGKEDEAAPAASGMV